MSTYSTLRGHETINIDGEWFYSDTMEPAADTWEARDCGHCNKKNTPEGHDGCLGTLIGLMNACCGHGRDAGAYVQFLDGNAISGKDAVIILNVLKKNSGNVEHTALTEEQVGLMREFMRECRAPIK